ncbi:acyl carrier protein [Streptomyces sp. NRRL B-1347]|uniref:acyl carrier protein n=1 Tax=Streptomyces sp. NRRL B-1347 TaxID=1476877 RepID=UPI00068DBA81|nr:acyl carrier protein [Streptomyces sp. NRRL B-1347]
MTTEPGTAHGAPPSFDEALHVVEAALHRELPHIKGDIGPEEHLDLLPGADSVRLMRVVANLERTYGVELEDEEIRAAETVGELTGLLRSAIEASKAGQ